MLTFIKSLFQTFYSAPFYRRFAAEGRGIGLGYMVLAAFLGAIGYLHAPMLNTFLEQEKALFAQLPTITVAQGQLSMDAPAPQSYDIFKDMPGGPLKIIIDPSADTSRLDEIKNRMMENNVFLFVSKDKVVLLDRSNTDLDVTDLKNVKDAHITQEDWGRIGEQMAQFIAFSLFFMFLGASFLGHVFAALAGGFLLQIISPPLRVVLPYKACLRVAAAAQIPTACVALATTPHLALQGLVWFGFAAFGLLASRNEKPATP